jgi:S1-C subfamily serine protease
MIKKIVLLLLLSNIGCATSPERVYKETNDKVVLIHMIYDKGGGLCSGAFINEEGIVLTCAHCFAEHTHKIFIKTSSGEVINGVLLNLDPVRDLAAIYTGREDLPFFDLGSPVHIGQRVFAFGSPLGLQNSMSVGYVENVATVDKKLVIHSSFVNPGNSGGPLVNNRGELVGINEAILMINPLFPAQGLFLSIDAAEIRHFLSED